MTTPSTIASLNNNAAELIERGQFVSAVSLLSCALQKAQQAICGDLRPEDKAKETKEESSKKRARQSSVTTSSDGLVCQREIQDRCLRRRQAEGEAPTFSRKDESPAYEGKRKTDFYIYDHPIYVDQSTIGNLTEDGTHQLSSVLVFNLALAHHLGAIASTPSNNKDKGETVIQAKTSLRLYELAFQMQLRNEVPLDMTYTLAILNNSAVLQQRAAAMGSSDTRTSFRRLTRAFMLLVVNGGAEVIHEVDGFLWNISKAVLSTNVLAPAA